ncbi:MAG TPA: aspartyl protease family protein [Opitutaceae bacterium]
MKRAARGPKPEDGGRKAPRARGRLSLLLGRWSLVLLALACLLTFSSCRGPAGPKPGRTRLASRLVVIPAQLYGNHLVVEVEGDKRGPARFLIDTGSSVTLITPDYASRFATELAALDTPQVRVRAANGELTTLTSVTLRRIALGDARFENVQALVYDCAELSAHLGVKLDGVLGFPLFRDTILTLDYPQSRLIVTPAGEPPLTPGARIAFDNTTKVPLIPIQLGDKTLLALIDSGSDGPLNLNPVGLGDLRWVSTPRPGASVGTLLGNRMQEVGRLADTLQIGLYPLPEPVVDLTDELSSLGGEVLRHFTITFDQARGNVTFHRETPAPLPTPPKRSLGLSFAKTPAYWRVASVVPGSPADTLGVQVGDLITRLNGELVEKWDLRRYRELIDQAVAIDVTLLDGRVETTRRIEVFDLVR